eukprot:610347-Pyramimonas_sp.AAC.1
MDGSEASGAKVSSRLGASARTSEGLGTGAEAAAAGAEAVASAGFKTLVSGLGAARSPASGPSQASGGGGPSAATSMAP